MAEPGKKDELRRTGIALMIVGCGLMVFTGIMAVLTIDGFRKHEGELTAMFAAAVVVLLGGIGCITAATVHAARRARAASRTTQREADPD